MKVIKVIICVILLSCFHTVHSQSLNTAQAKYDEFMSLFSSGGESLNSYHALYSAYDEYMKVYKTAEKESAEWQLAKNALNGLFPHLYRGAYFYTAKNNPKKTLDFVVAFMDITTNEDLCDDNFEKGNDYGTFAWMAATKAYNNKDYSNAVKYLNAYINSGDASKRADAFNFMAKSYIYLNDDAHAIYVLDQGLTFYPENASMLASIINLLSKTKSNDEALQKYVTKALETKPQDEGLINIQAQLFERTQKYEKAIDCYKKLKEMKPQSLEIARHLALNYYNAGVVYVQKYNTMMHSSKNKKDASMYKSLAGRYFISAAQNLDQVLYSDPMAVNYAYALANVYLFQDNTAKLQEVNKRITALGHQPVDNKSDIDFISYDNVAGSTDLMANVPAQVSNKQPARTPAAPKEKKAFSDVDVNIPVNDPTNVNTYVTIIANEKYTRVAEVPNAENDGNVFAEYCNKVLGIPNDNIRKHLNVTYGEMLDAIEDIKSIAKIKKGDCNIIVYYAGHGVPDEKTKSAYILPVDADGKQTRVCYSLSEFYAELSALNANCTTVFLDACFSGATRSEEGEMLMSARSIAIDVDDSEIDGKLVVFSAASGDQTALAYDEKHHGMFTYFLLKKLKDTKGNVNLADLGKYITEEVSLQARLKNHKEQTPSVVSGLGFGDEWEKMKLK